MKHDRLILIPISDLEDYNVEDFENGEVEEFDEAINRANNEYHRPMWGGGMWRWGGNDDKPHKIAKNAFENYERTAVILKDGDSFPLTLICQIHNQGHIGVSFTITGGTARSSSIKVECEVTLRAHAFSYAGDPFTESSPPFENTLLKRLLTEQFSLPVESSSYWTNTRCACRNPVAEGFTEKPGNVLDLDHLFEAIRPPKNSPSIAQPPGLTISLHPFQKRALHWMLCRERDPHPDRETLHPLWQTVHLPSGKDIYQNVLNLQLSSIKYPPPPVEPGGLLCEEMGLGKTVEILSLILAHPREASQRDYSRSRKLIDDLPEKRRPTTVKATLIVVPQSILLQWYEETKARVEPGALKYVVYHGIQRTHHTVQKRGGMNTMIVSHELVLNKDSPMKQDAGKSRRSGRAVRAPQKYQPGTSSREKRDNLPAFSDFKMVGKDGTETTFEDYDIIFTSYRALQEDIDAHTPSHPSPLLRVQWWRVILDEAQMVHDTSSKAAVMASELWRVNAWTVTGTPISESLADLHGLLVFLDHDPFASQYVLKKLFLEPYAARTKLGIDRMRGFLPKILWRHSKRHVQHEISIPPRTDTILPLTLSPPEQVMYDNKKQDAVRHVEGQLHNISMRAQGAAHMTDVVEGISFNRSILNTLMELRQVCCHPQFAGGRHATVHIDSDNKQTFDEIMGQLQYERTKQLDETLRRYCRAINRLLDRMITNERGMASRLVDRLDPEFLAKQDRARELEKERNEAMRQRYNEMLGRTEDDEAKELERLYGENVDELAADPIETEEEKAQSMAKRIRANENRKVQIQHELTAARVRIRDFLLKLRKEVVSCCDRQAKLPLNAVGKQGADGFTPAQRTWNQIKLHALTLLAGEAVDLEGKVVTRMVVPTGYDGSKVVVRPDSSPYFNAPDGTVLVENIGHEGITAEGQPGHFVVYDAKFALDVVEVAKKLLPPDGKAKLPPKKGKGKEEAEKTKDKRRAFGHSASPESNFGDTIATLETAYARTDRQATAAQCDLHFIENKREAHDTKTTQEKKTMKLVERTRSQILEMSQSSDILDDIPSSSTKGKEPVGTVVSTASKGKDSADRVSTTAPDVEEMDDDGACPICMDAYDRPVVTPCAHIFCLECISGYLNKKGRHGPCPMCRKDISLNDLVEIELEAPHDPEELVDVSQNGTKIDALIKDIRTRMKADSSFKAVVFSQWSKLLERVCTSLQEADISVASLTGSDDQREQALSDFRMDPTMRILLVSMKSSEGAAGLTLTMATVCYLMEPAINFGLEDQSINRIHRIGQTRTTTVVRLIIKGSIEEKIIELQRQRRGNRGKKETGKQEIKRKTMEVLDMVDMQLPMYFQQQFRHIYT